MPAESITQGSFTRRSHMRDLGGGGLTIHNSPHLRARAQARMYDQWGSLNKHSVHYDSEHCQTPIPVGRVRYRRTYQVARPEQDTLNFYQSCALMSPGPGEFDAVARQNSMGQDMRPFRPIFSDRGFGSGNRPCLKALSEKSPGPGSYELSGAAQQGHLSQSFSTIAREHNIPELESCAIALKNLMWRIARIHESTDVNNRMAPGKRRVLQVEGRKDLKAMEARAREIRRVMQSIREYQEYQRSLGTRHSKASRLANDRMRAKSHPLSDQTGRFRDPIADTSTNRITPGPASYCPESILTMGLDTISKAAAFTTEVRPCGSHAPASKSIAAVKLTKDGHPYFADLNEPGPSEYAPPNFPTKGMLFDPSQS